MKRSHIILNHNVSSIVDVSDQYQCNIFNVTFQSLSNDRIQNIHFMSENKSIVSLQPYNCLFSILFYFILQMDAKNNVRKSICSMTWYKAVTYLKTRVYVNDTTKFGRVISF